MKSSAPIRQACPPGACNCGRERLLDSPGGDPRSLLLTRAEEGRLLEQLGSRVLGCALSNWRTRATSPSCRAVMDAEIGGLSAKANGKT